MPNEGILCRADASCVHCRSQVFVGYSRVSSRRQAHHGDSLEVQRAQLQAYAGKSGALLIALYEDQESAGHGAWARRSGLKKAIDDALNLRVPLLVSSIDRLSRSKADLKFLTQSGLTIFCTDRGRVRDEVLAAAVKKAEAENEIKSRRAKISHAKRRAVGASMVPPGFREGRAKGCAANKSRALRRVTELMEAFQQHPLLLTLTRADRVAWLNKKGPRNLKGAGGYRENWTIESLRPVEKKAKALLSALIPDASSGERHVSTKPMSAKSGSFENLDVRDQDTVLDHPSLFGLACTYDRSEARVLEPIELRAIALVCRDGRYQSKLAASPRIRSFMEGILKQPERVLPLDSLKIAGEILRRFAR